MNIASVITLHLYIFGACSATVLICSMHDIYPVPMLICFPYRKDCAPLAYNVTWPNCRC